MTITKRMHKNTSLLNLISTIMQDWDRPNQFLIGVLWELSRLQSVRNNELCDRAQTLITQFLEGSDKWYGEVAGSVKGELRIRTRSE